MGLEVKLDCTVCGKAHGLICS